MDESRLIERIVSGIAALRQEVPAHGAEMLARLLTELERWNSRMNLTGIRDVEAMVRGHLLDSLAVRPLIYGKSLIDIGTGAGFPGLPIAIMDPGLDVVLLDSNARKMAFVRHVVGTLEISNAEAVLSRAEDYAPGRRFDTVIARALTKLPRLIEIAGHLVAEKGVLLAQKGGYPEAELADVPAAWRYDVKELSIPGLERRRVVVLGRRDNDE